MQQKITPFLWFNTQAEEAMNFYISVFSGSPVKKAESKIVSIKRYPNGPLEGPMKGMEGKILTAVFELQDQTFMALDGGPFFKPTGAMSLYVDCDSQEEVDYFWNKLTEGADPNAQQCGWLQDKYGFSWQIIPKALPELLNKDTSGRVMQTMMLMKKIDVAKLQQAYDNKKCR